MFKIDKNVSIPKNVYKSEYPFLQMEVGDSFFVSENDKAFSKLRQSAHYFGKINNVKFKTKTVDGGKRCWRIK